MQIGLSETSILKEYHVDAVERYNVTCDFPGVIRELTDPHKRFPFQVCRTRYATLAALMRFCNYQEHC